WRKSRVCQPRRARLTFSLDRKKQADMTGSNLACFASDLLLTKNMVKSRKRKRKTRGRPRTGIRPMVGVRVSNQTRAAVKRWASMQVDKPTLSEALRRLIDIGLKSLNAFE